MEELKDLLEKAKKANKTIDEGMNELAKLQGVLASSKDKESIERVNKAIQQAKDLKKQLDGYNSK